MSLAERASRYTKAMPLTVRDDLSVPIPEEVASQMGIHPGSPVQWERTSDGGYTLRPDQTRREAVEGLGEVLKPYLKEQGGGVEAFLKWRREDARLDGSL